MEIKNFILTYKKDTLNSCRINLNKELVDILKLDPQNREVGLIYENGKVILEDIKNIEREELKKEDENKNLILLKTILKVQFEEKKNNYKLQIPVALAKALELEKDKRVIIEIIDNKVILKKIEESNISENHKKAEVFMISVKKGGVGKSFTAINLAHGLSFLRSKKVLLLSSDTQNDHIFNLMTTDEILEKSDGNIKNEDGKIVIKKGLKAMVLNDLNYEDVIMEARENLFVIPLEKDIFKLTTDQEFRDYKKYVKKFPEIIEKLKSIFDIILIDGIPVSDIDHFYSDVADKLIIPLTLDEATIRGAINMITTVGVDKIHSILISRYRNTSSRNKYLETLDKFIKGTSIIYPAPIKELSDIEKLVKAKKTIFESKSKYLKEAQMSFIEIIKNM